jgi:hypothetical protein
MQRKDFIQKTALAAVTVAVSKYSFSIGNSSDFPVVRIAESNRKFKSKAVEKLIEDVKKNIANKELAWMFENSFPNTLDTTVDFEMIDGKPDTYVNRRHRRDVVKG